MDMTPFIVLSLVAVAIGLQLFLRHKALRSKGQSATLLKSALPDLNMQETSLVYCFSPTCGPCKAMLPAIDELATDHPNVHKLDITRHTELARDIGIRATPTTLLIEDGKISDIMLGTKNLKHLRKLMGPAR